jgi:hypothetical protein
MPPATGSKEPFRVPRLFPGAAPATEDGKVNLDLIEPTGMHRAMRRRQIGIAVLQPRDRSVAAVGRAVVHNPKHTAGQFIRSLSHRLFDQPIKRGDPALGFTTAKDFGLMHTALPWPTEYAL